MKQVSAQSKIFFICISYAKEILLNHNNREFLQKFYIATVIKNISNLSYFVQFRPRASSIKSTAEYNKARSQSIDIVMKGVL